MGLTEITDFLKIINELPAGWKVTFLVVFFLLPKLIQTLGGGKAIGKVTSRVWLAILRIIRRYQARKERESEDQALTEAYTRTLVVEALNAFSQRLVRIDHKVNHILLLLDEDGDIEVIELTKPERNNTDTIVHHRLDERLKAMREAREKD